MIVNFTACDKDSSDGFQRTVRAETAEQLQAAWSEFEKDVPFGRWYHDNTLEEGTDEDREALENLE